MTLFNQIIAKLAEKTDKMSELDEGISFLNTADCKTNTVTRLFLEDNKVFAEVKSRFESRHYVRELTVEDFIFDRYVSLEDGKSGTLQKEILAKL